MLNYRRTSWALLVAGAAVSIVAGAQYAPTQNSDRASGSESRVMPRYASDGGLLLPSGYREWVFVGSSLGLSYSEEASGTEMFLETLMEPTAYKHYVATKTFREGTMFVLILHGAGEKVLPARRGRFAADIHGVEMAVKDSAHRPEGWAYYNFGGMMGGGLRATAQANRKEACYNCHAEHAKRDNVFLQFYSMLSDR